MGVLAIFCLLLIPEYRAPGIDGGKMKMINDTIARNETETPKGAEKDGADGGKDGNEKSEKKEEGHSICRVMCRRANIPLFTFVAAVLIFHSGNDAVLPLLSQYVAVHGQGSDVGAAANCTSVALNCTGSATTSRAGIPYASANIALAQTTSMLTALTMGKMIEMNLGYKLPMFIGFGALSVRCTTLVLLLYFFPNTYALIATQLIDGIGDGVVHMSYVVVTQALTQETGHFGMAMGLVQVADNLGNSISNLLGGYLVTETSYAIGFACLGALGSSSVFIVCCLREPGRKKKKKKRKKDKGQSLKSPLLEGQENES